MQPGTGDRASAGRRVAVVLAAGQGQRMRSARPKVLHEAAGRPLLEWVVEAARGAGCAPILVVVGHGASEVRERLGGRDLTWVLQAEQRGTGHALAQAEAHLPEPATVLVLSGDAPLVRPATLESLLTAAATGWGAMAVAELSEPGSLGRVLARSDGTLERIVEVADARPEELVIRRVNAGLYALPAPQIFADLDRLRPDNAKGEIYLTDALTAAAARGEAVRLVTLEDPSEALGVNTRQDLARVQRRFIERKLDQLMAAGVTILAPERTVVEPAACVGRDTVLHPGVSLLGHTRVGSGCILHQGAWVRDSRLADRVQVGPYSVLDGAEIEAGGQVPALARIGSASVLLPREP